ncbi:hypothetical protein HNQ60_000220 [Povalibacter uvarum]|uniref:Nucleoprotein/polynucleotide-associated enzyme n=1 Tax=Povalibacter uvarum TaxID=732238 RepID=A0A841HFL7_9GAMM|nr:DUF2058 domain-containing protein [Povalibacter uvarum]MBB6091374.1 hypothetical protein [Povalibacter uvarum]
MSMSLREQLLAAGLVSKKQAEQVEKQQKQKHHHHAKSGKPAQDEAAKRAAQQAQAAKAARDQELNRQRQEQAEQKARAAQVKQLIEENRLPKLETDDYFNYVDRGKVRRMSVDAQRREQIMAGTLMIVRLEGRYEVVPKDIAEKVRERSARAVVTLNQSESEAKPAEDDPYKDFVVPDDLRW